MKLVEVGWGRSDPSYRQIFSTGFLPGGTLEQINSMSELQLKSATPEGAVRIMRSMFSVDIREAAARVKCPTLILHAAGDRRCPLPMGQAYHTALKARQVPTGLVIYPDEGHGIKQPKHREDVHRRVLDWFAKYDK